MADTKKAGAAKSPPAIPDKAITIRATRPVSGAALANVKQRLKYVEANLGVKFDIATLGDGEDGQ